MFNSTILSAWASLKRNRLRTTLTVAAIGIGIATIICTTALGRSGSDRIESQISAVGEDFLWIRPGSRNLAGVRTGWGGANTLKVDDATALETLPSIRACSPVIQGREQLIAGHNNWNTRYLGVLPSYFGIRHRTVAAGTTFTDADLASGQRVLVLGLQVSRQLFGDENPVGRTIRMNRFPFTIIGVLDSKGTGRGGVDRDDVAFVPLPIAHRNLDRRDSVSDIMCGVRSPELMAAAETNAAALLRERHRLEPGDRNDFEIQKPLETLALRARAAETMSMMLAAISAISLIVAGVGIMNIMLVSVTERRREIGIRMAIGARMRDIRRQFLLEAGAIGVIGGAGGLALGWAATRLFAAGLDWPMTMSIEAAASAAVSAVVAGLVFGYYPAHQASRMDPIEAMRTEK